MSRKPSFMLMLVVMLLTLLVVLATLQYRWVGQVSRSEHERLQTNLQVDVIHFADDFDREITRVFMTFQMEAAPLATQSWTEYVQRYEQWMMTAPYPELVSGFYVVKADEKGQLQLACFDATEKKFFQSQWPEEFEQLRTLFEEQYQKKVSKTGQLLSYAVPSILEEIPALVIPLSTVQYLGEGKGFNVTSVFGYTLVKLNLNCIKQELIPTLAKQDLSVGDQVDYDMVIVSRRLPPKIVYQSMPSAQADFEHGDADRNLFSVQFHKFSNLLRESQLLSKNVVGKKNKSSESVSVNVFNQSSGEIFVGAMPPVNDETGRWQVILKHRSGSLDKVIAQARQRNLMISFGILLLLAVSVVVVVISTRRAQQLARQQMEFVAAVSHELRTPLSVICSASENLADGVVLTPQRVSQYGDLIRREGRRLTEMVEQVLEFAGVQSGRKIYQFHTLEVRELLESILVTYQTLFEEGRFHLELDLQPNLPPVMADEVALRRALQNLLNNAMKYSGENRWIRLRVHLSEGSLRKEILILIEDRGLGIAPEDVPHIFEQFFRSRDVVEAQIRGSGLGLSLVKHIIEAHGGKITVDSTLGQGSLFTVHLPALSKITEPNINPEKEAYEPTNITH